ncbi:type II toxin-antitoxin system RelE/ParE family toxin [Kitasatospora acidiphila]|uniref:Type II toxin-antitoxin system RelE/ParE family toxin n=1 Tax=Kitasatospora acidiphila TaxID=2567942 RepID=A0A540W8A8_9ACTN|nr:type II toxin-antitoxin system RelE/ParE family toxin [Kitasatospora acidiphila]TQF05167.1 type II toxin-antitoxin system RelE/ParE family toxin [Kitasatospora acidiphila]
MKYAFRFTTHARRQLRSIGQAEALRILAALTPLGDDPYADNLNVRKLAGQDGLYRLRVGDYRLIYQVHDQVLVVLVVNVGNRRDVYRNL